MEGGPVQKQDRRHPSGHRPVLAALGHTVSTGTLTVTSEEQLEAIAGRIQPAHPDQ